MYPTLDLVRNLECLGLVLITPTGSRHGQTIQLNRGGAGGGVSSCVPALQIDPSGTKLTVTGMDGPAFHGWVENTDSNREQALQALGIRDRFIPMTDPDGSGLFSTAEHVGRAVDVVGFTFYGDPGSIFVIDDAHVHRDIPLFYARLPAMLRNDGRFEIRHAELRKTERVWPGGRVDLKLTDAGTVRVYCHVRPV